MNYDPVQEVLITVGGSEAIDIGMRAMLNPGRRLIEQRMALMGVHNMSAYIRKMCIDGYIVQLQIKELDECAKLLRYTSNNVNRPIKVLSCSCERSGSTSS